MLERELTERDLANARAALAKFTAEIDDERLLARLADERPVHPLLMGYRLGLAALAALVTLSLASLGAPLLGASLARQVAALGEIAGLPLPLVFLLLGYSAGALGVSLRWFAIQRARHSPMLSDERRQHDILREDVRRAEAQLREIERSAAHRSA